jgi:hypothetical protein
MFMSLKIAAKTHRITNIQMHTEIQKILKKNEKLTLLFLLLLVMGMLPRHAERCPNKEADDEHLHLHLATVIKNN